MVSPIMRKFIIGYLVLFFLLISLVVALRLSSTNQDVRQQAAVDNIDFTLVPSKASVSPEETFTIDVFVTTHSKQLTAVDLSIQDSGNFDFISFTKSNLFDSVTPYGNQTATLLYDQASGGGTYDSQTRTARIAVGAVCDPCYIGTPPNPNPDNLPMCLDNPEPQCYPKSTNTGASKIATLTLRAKTSGTGSNTFTLTPETQSTAINFIDDVTGVRGSAIITINSGTTPNPSPTIGTITCTGDVNKDNKVNSTDFNLVVSNFAPLSTCPANDFCTGDVNGDKKVNSTDFNLVVSNFAPLVTCN